MSDPQRTAPDAVFAPQSVALVGLSGDMSRPAGRVLGLLRRGGYSGRIHVVNPARSEIAGLPSHGAVGDLPEVPEHAYILTGRDRVEAAVRACAEAGVRVATVLADGFAETGAEGRARQDRLVDIARTGGLRLLGPNAMGVADLHARCLLTVNAVYEDVALEPGRLALISQSGSMIGALVSRAEAMGLAFSRVAAVGNEADLGVAELGLACVDDPNTGVVLLFLETIRDAPGLVRLAGRAHARGKPVLALKLGRSAVGAEMAVAHTGALLGEDAVSDAFLRDIGIARVDHLDALIEAAPLFEGRVPPDRAMRVGVLTTTGGGGAVVCDRLALAGVDMVPPGPDTLQAVRATGLDIVAGPVLDLTMAGAGPDFVRPAVEAVAADGDVDLVVSISGSSARAAPERTVPPLAEARRGGKPLACFLTPEAPETVRGLTAAGIACFRTPESCADAIGAFSRWRAPRISRLAQPPRLARGRALDEAAGLARLARAGVPVVPVVTLGVGETPALPFAYPVVLKALSADVPHKTDAGGVALGLDSAEALGRAGPRLKAAVEAHCPGVEITRLLAAPMLSLAHEVLIGYRLDGVVGPVVTLAPGGVAVGLDGDKAVRLAPVDLPTARGMIRAVRSLAPLFGYRNRPGGNVEALAKAIVALSSLADAADVLEAEANPVMVSPAGATAVDALVIVEDEG